MCLGTLLLAAACADGPFRQEEAGRFSVTFTFEGTRPSADEVLYVLGAVRRVSTDDGSATRVTEAGPVRYQPGVTLGFGNVPPGDGYVVAVEFRDTPSLDGTVRRYGISQPFSLHPGDDRTVEVRVNVRRAPSTADGFALAADVVPGRTHARTTVDLLLSGAAGTRVQLSNDLSMACDGSGGTPCEVTLGDAPLEATATDGTWRVRDWPLGDLQDTSTCAACTRTVYARFVDAEGYASDVLAADVALDLVAPRINWVAGTDVATAGHYGLGTTIILALESDEPVDWGSGAPVLVHGMGTLALDPSAAFATYREWRRGVDALTPEGTLDVDLAGVVATDAAGNVAVLDAVPLQVRVDVTAPVITWEAPASRLVRPTSGRVVTTLGFTVVNQGGSDLGSVRLAMPDVDCPLNAEGTHTCAVDIPARTGSGAAYTEVFRADAVDGAGNTASAVASLEVDGNPPRLAFSSLVYLPDPDNTLPSVSHARAGTTLQLFLVPDEEVDPASLDVRVLFGGGNSLPLLPDGPLPSPVRFIPLRGVVPAPAPPDGTYAIQVTWSDMVKNTADVADQAPRVRILASRPELALLQDRLLLVREPTGGPVTVPANTNSAERDGGIMPGGGGEQLDGGAAGLEGNGGGAARAAPVERIVGTTAAGTIEEALSTAAITAGADRNIVRVRAHEWPVDAPFADDAGVPTGRVLANVAWETGADAGPAALPVEPSVGRGVVLVAVDSAGNESPPVPLQRMELRLQHRAPQAGPPAQEFTLSAQAHDHALPRAALLASDGLRDAHPAVASADGTSLSVPSMMAWRQVAREDAVLNGLGNPRVVQDTLRDRLVYVGTETGTDTLTTTLLVREWDGDNWLVPALGALDNPPATFDVVFHPGLGATLLLGGRGGVTEVHAWDGNAWLLLDTNRYGPSAPVAAAYDVLHGVVVVLDAPGAASTPAWTFDGTAWAPLPTLNTALQEARLVYDPVAGTSLAFTLAESPPRAFLLGGNAWAASTGFATGAPAGLLSASATTHADGNTTVLSVVGTLMGTRVHHRGTRAGTMWTWDDHEVPPPGSSTGSMEGMSLVRDHLRGRTALIMPTTTAGDPPPTTTTEGVSVLLVEREAWRSQGRGPLRSSLDVSTCVVPPSDILPAPLLLVSGASDPGVTTGIPRAGFAAYAWREGGWRTLQNDGTVPSPVGGFACAQAQDLYGENSKIVAVVWGGKDPSNLVTADAMPYRATLSANDTTLTWTQGVPAPHVRQGAAMALDMRRSPPALVITGGLLSNGNALGAIPWSMRMRVEHVNGDAREVWETPFSGGPESSSTGHALTYVPDVGLVATGVRTGPDVAGIFTLPSTESTWQRASTFMVVPFPPVSATYFAERGTLLVSGRLGATLPETARYPLLELPVDGSTLSGRINTLGAPGLPRDSLPSAPILAAAPESRSVVLAAPSESRTAWDTWVLDTGAGRSAAAHAVFNLSAAAAPPGHVQSLDIRVRASTRTGEQAVLLGWRHGGTGVPGPGAFTSVGTFMGTGALADHAWTPADPARLLFTDADGVPRASLQLRSRPREDISRAVPPLVTVDHVELRARFCTLPDGSRCP